MKKLLACLGQVVYRVFGPLSGVLGLLASEGLVNQSFSACVILGDNTACVGRTNAFVANPDNPSPGLTYLWLITTNTSGAAILDTATNASVDILTATNGVFGLQCTVTDGTNSETCSTNISVSPLSTADGLTNQTVCPHSDVVLNIVAQGTGPMAFTWRKDGVILDGATSSSLSLANVTVADSGNYCVEVSSSCNTTTNCAILTVTPPPALTCPSNLLVSCLGDVPSPDTNSVSVPTPATVSYVADLTAASNCLVVITRIYQAVDSCGSTSTCSQLITIANTNPPILTCSSNRTVQCGSAWDFTAPVAVEFCGGTNVTITATGTTTNPLVGQTFIATRSWTAMDSCSNVSSCSQTITIIDTTPPQIFCSSNLVVECAGPAGTPAFFTTTATDACDTNVTVVSTPPSGSSFSLGTNTVFCVATDASGNSNVCSFTVTVVDTTPPQITCSPKINVAESPRDSGSAIVTCPPPTATDICDNSLNIFSSPVSGSTLPNGSNTVTCTAVDASGNSNSCTYIVRVIPYHLYVTNSADSGPGTLREALSDANDSPDENLISFSLPGSAPYTIHLLTPLPAMTSPTIIDGWSQTGSNSAPVVELDGGGTTNAFDGLVIDAGNSTIRGLALYGFATAIRLETNGLNVLQGNFIGTDSTGTNAAGNSVDGVYVSSPRNLIGGTGAGLGNLISGNARDGIQLDGMGASNNVVQGNLIGVAADAASPLGNGADGILLANLAFRNLVGGITNGAANRIAFNAGNGIALNSSAGSRNLLAGNSIYANGGLAIDLGRDGVTPNDSDDSDSGPNDLQNFPILSDAQSADGKTTIFGSLTSAQNRTFRVEFYLNDVADPSGYGEGQILLGSSTVNIHGNGPESFTVTFPVTAIFTQFVTATATDPFGNTSEFSPAVQVRTPPVLGSQPASTNAPAGDPATFCATATGTPPIFYQWRLNGVNIPGATNACYTVSAADVTNGGSYSVIVGNELGALGTTSASLSVPLTDLEGGDHFTNRVAITGLSGIVAGQNRNATFEPDEPLHAGKVGGKSVWYSWQAPVTGVATFQTLGSTFDTLLAIYKGNALSNLFNIDSDEDRGGFYTSRTDFNAIKGVQYDIAVDGSGGAEGDFVLAWSEEDTPKLLPFIVVQPLSQTVASGSTVTFTTVALRVCGLGQTNCSNPLHYPDDELPQLYYQWYFSGEQIAGATTPSLTISNVQPESLGIYRMRVSTRYQFTDSQDANLQINDTGSDVEDVQAVDKFQDADLGNILHIGGPPGNSNAHNGVGTFAASSIVRGFTGTQIFNTAGSATGPGEVICGTIGGASEWITFQADASGTLFLTTDGSSYDTVMAVFRRSATNASVLELLACDNNGGANGKTSSLNLSVEVGKTNYILVDGVNGATGILQLNYSLVTGTAIKLLGLTVDGMQHLQVSGRTNLHFTIQASADMLSWSSLVTATSASGVFDYIDTSSALVPKRYYRAVLLP